MRVLHSLSFIEDPTRLLRAVRFEQRFGFRIEERTLQLVEEARPMLKQVSGDRLRHELDLILSESHVQDMLSRLAELGILQAIHPDLPDQLDVSHLADPPAQWGLAKRYGGIPARRLIAYLVWLGQVNPGQARSIAARLKFPRILGDSLLEAVQLRQDLPELVGEPASQAAARLEGVPLTVLWTLYRTVPDPSQRQVLENYVLRWSALQPLTNGDTLRALGVPPGPGYRSLLKSLRDAWLDGKVNTYEHEQALLQELLKEMVSRP